MNEVDHTKGIHFEGRSYLIINTKGDGNCLFHSIVASNKTNITDAFILRRYIYSTLERWISSGVPMIAVINTVYGALGEDRVSLQHFVNRQKSNGEWGSTLDMVFASLVLNINIYSISNMPKKFEVFSTKDFLKKIQVHHIVTESSATIYMYHHVFGDIYSPSINPNHFCALLPVNEDEVPWIKWYDRSTDKDYESALLLKMDEESPEISTANQSASFNYLGKDNNGVTVVTKGYQNKKPRKKVLSTMPLKVKESKQSILNTWLIAGTDAERLKLMRMQEQSLERSKFEEEIEGKFGHSADKPDSESIIIPVIDCVNTAVSRAELSWNERAQRIYLYLHPELANKKMSIVRWDYPKLLDNTFRNWLKRHDMICKWIPIIKHLKAEDVIQNVENDAAKHKLRRFFSGKKSIDIAPYCKRLSTTQNVVLVASDRQLATKLVYKAKKQDGYAYLKKTAKRLNQAGKTKNLKYQEAHNFIWKLVQERWKSGQPITKSEVRMECRKTFTSGDFFDNVLDKGGNTNHFYVFLKRSLERINFTDRKATISQHIPLRWKDLAREGAARVLNSFRKKNVGAVMAADETFIHFHERNSRFLVPSGEKRVGSAGTFNEKEGCTLMVTMDMLTSSLLRPFIIFAGKFGKTLMKQWQGYSNSIVLFTEKHWMTSETNVLYLQYIADLYKGLSMRVGLIYDDAPTHVCDKVKQAMKNINKNRPDEEELVVEFIDPCLTSIYQPADVAVNAPLKKMIREEYHNHVSKLYRSSEQSTSLKPGDKIPISREDLVGFIENAYNNINTINKKNRWIAEYFKTCGLDPWSDNTNEVFEAHLERLSESQVYKALVDQHTAVELSERMSLKRILD